MKHRITGGQKEIVNNTNEKIQEMKTDNGHNEPMQVYNSEIIDNTNAFSQCLSESNRRRR